MGKQNVRVPEAESGLLKILIKTWVLILNPDSSEDSRSFQPSRTVGTDEGRDLPPMIPDLIQEGGRTYVEEEDRSAVPRRAQVSSRSVRSCVCPLELESQGVEGG